MKKNIILALTILLSIFAEAATDVKPPETTKTIDLSSQESKVEFLAVGKPSMLKINGTGGKLKGHVRFTNLIVDADCTVPLEGITTGIGLRDEHMKNKYLEIAKFPEATLKISELKIEKDFLKEKGIQKNIPFKGKLKIHGNESDVEGTADIASDDKNISIQAKTKTNITAHKIDVPSYLGIKVADEVEIKVDLKIKK